MAEQTHTQDDQRLELVQEMLEIAKASLLLNLRFLDTAFSFLTLKKDENLDFATNGHMLWVGPDYMIAQYKNNPSIITRNYLHLILHCVFAHPFFDKSVQVHLWDLACDIAVEAAINDLDLALFREVRSQEQQAYLSCLKQELGMLSAEKLYAHFKEQALSVEEAKRQRQIFYADNHAPWYDFNLEDAGTKAYSKASDVAGESKANKKADEDRSGTKTDHKNKEQPWREKSSRGAPTVQKKDKPENAKEALGPRYANTVGLDRSRDRWKNAAYQMGVELESFASLWGAEGSHLLMQLKRVTREKQSYEDFLRSFALMREHIHLNNDEFDYIYYCYGLDLFKNVALIEPLEYVEAKRVRDFVIAIDTSSSTKDELVHKFFTKTYNILHEQESFTSRINLYVIQADAEIQEVVHISSREDFDKYLQTVEVKGLGGTDFRPVFEYVNRLVEEGMFENLGGLIYFTDGQGTYPRVQPDYKCAFVFVDDDGFGQNLAPSWAIKLNLEREDIANFEYLGGE